MVFCLLGAGHIGSQIARELTEFGLRIADVNFEKAERLAREVGGEAVKFDANDESSVLDAVKGCEVVLNAVGPYYIYGEKILRAVIKAGKDYVDINDDYDATQKCIELDEEAKKKAVCCVIGCGATPGVTNVLARFGADKIGEVDAIHTYWAWTALDPTMGPAIIYHFLHASDGMIPVYRNGKIEFVRALSESEFFEFPEPIGRLEVANVGHPEPVTIPRHIKVKKVTNKGTIWPEIMLDLTKKFSKLGFTSMKVCKIKSLEIPVREIIVSLVEQLPNITPEDQLNEILREALEKFGDFAIYGVGLGVRVVGEKEVTYRIAYPSAVELTAFPAAIAAKFVYKGELRKGVLTPEELPAKDFLDELRKRVKVEGL